MQLTLKKATIMWETTTTHIHCHNSNKPPHHSFRAGLEVTREKKNKHENLVSILSIAWNSEWGWTLINYWILQETTQAYIVFSVFSQVYNENREQKAKKWELFKMEEKKTYSIEDFW